jgi:hypothetical protein
MIFRIYRPVQAVGIKRSPCIPRKIVDRIISVINLIKNLRNSANVLICRNFISRVT